MARKVVLYSLLSRYNASSTLLLLDVKKDVYTLNCGVSFFDNQYNLSEDINTLSEHPAYSLDQPLQAPSTKLKLPVTLLYYHYNCIFTHLMLHIVI